MMLGSGGLGEEIKRGGFCGGGFGDGCWVKWWKERASLLVA